VSDQHHRHAERDFISIRRSRILRLDRNVECCRRSSAISSFGLTTRHCDHDALAHATGELMR